VIEYFDAPDIKKRMLEIIEVLRFDHVDPERVHCIRSRGSQAKNTVARIHGLGRIWQETLRMEPTYILEITSPPRTWTHGASGTGRGAETWGWTRYKSRREQVHSMYPSLTVKVVEEPTTLREFIATLRKDALYAYDRRVVGVIVNDRRLWDSAKLKPGDRVVVFPIIVGG